jgi:hypothetical protein
MEGDAARETCSKGCDRKKEKRRQRMKKVQEDGTAKRIEVKWLQ